MNRLDRVKRNRTIEVWFRLIGLVVVTIGLVYMAFYIVSEGQANNKKYNMQVMCTTHGEGSKECATASVGVK